MKSNMKLRSKRRPTKRMRKAYLRGKLLEKRERLLERLLNEMESASIASGDIRGDTVDIAMLNLAQEEHFLAGTAESEAVAQIDRALERIEDGTYGVCEDCSRRIPQARLNVVPFASCCVRCQGQREREEDAAFRNTRWLDHLDDITEDDVDNPVFDRGARPGN